MLYCMGILKGIYDYSHESNMEEFMKDNCPDWSP